MNEMRVKKRNGELEDIEFDKIMSRIRKIGQEVNIQLNYSALVIKVIDQLYDKIETKKIDELAAEQCASLSTQHSDYATLASRIIISNHIKNTCSSFFSVVNELYEFKNIHGINKPLVSEELFEFTKKYSNEIDNMIDYKRDYLIDYFGFKTLERSYLYRIGNRIVERIQHMWMRVSIGIHGNLENENSLQLVKESYDLMSQKYFTHATPTLFNAGTPRPQLSSCYLIAMEDDSLDGIYNTLKDCAMISKWAGGIGLHIHNIRAKGSHIQGTNGVSNGLVPMLRVFNNTARYVDQCVLPETIIYTTNGPMEIQNCSFGDTQIYNLTGDVETIENVLEHPYEGEIYNIKTTHSLENLKITPEHPVYVLRHYEKKFEWLESKKLEKDDMLVYKVPDYSKDNYILSGDDCYMYGIILNNGCMDNTCQNGYIHLDSNKKQHILDFVVKYFDGKLIEYTINKVENITKIIWNKTINMPFRYNDIYDSNKNKYINSKWLNLPIEKSKYILKGLIDHDVLKENDFIFDNKSRILTESVRFLCLKLRILPICESETKIDDSKITNNKIDYKLVIPKTEEMCCLFDISYKPIYLNFLRYNNCLMSKIEDISVENYSGTLYDLQMKKEHNYMLHNGIVHNGGGKRSGSFAIYLEPWHADIEEFLEMRKNHGDEESKARDLFYALWINDLFMERVKNNTKWSLFCPYECPGLSDVYSEEFVKLYEKYESEGKAKKIINARDLWFHILDAQMETGTPYILYKDAANSKSNQKNLGTIKSSNLCCEIMEYSDKNETAVCNLASIGLPTFVNPYTKQFDYKKLHEVAKVVTNNLNIVIDVNFYPTEKTRTSNMNHRPIGIGVQGLADTFMLMDVAFHSDEAKEINKLIFETIYHAALEKSNENAIVSTPYNSFDGSPASKGILQFDMWGVEPSARYDWSSLKKSIIEKGLRNSLLVAPMPTASTSQILGFNECFEPFTSNLYSRRTIAGEFVVVNKYLMNELISLGLWNEEIKNNIIANKGSVQQLNILPQYIRNKYKIVWEIPMKHLIDMSSDRGAFICQSQSLNLWVEDPTYNTLTSMHFYSWKKGLKTGIYYLRRKAKHQAQQFTIEPELKHKVEENDDICEMCSA
jgi:ribonucleoside-diphosphate reductase alpha subunit